jgi:hypothetical protein
MRLIPPSTQHPPDFGSHYDHLDGDHFHEHHLDDCPPHSR